MVIDATVLLAIFFKENHDSWARGQLKQHRAFLQMSTVNLAEVLILVRDGQPHLFDQVREEIFASSIRFVPPSVLQAEIAARARLEYKKLNFGDCFAYALAKEKNCPILTLDSDFKNTDVKIIMP